MEQQVQDKIKQIIKDHENSLHHHYCGDEADKINHLLSHYRNNTASALADKKEAIEGTVVYFRSVVMLAESVGMGQTHGEKNARLRGLIELLNSAISKLRKEQTDEILNNWEYHSWSYSDYPYRSVLDKMNELKRENEELKKLIPKKEDELPM